MENVRINSNRLILFERCENWLSFRISYSKARNLITTRRRRVKSEKKIGHNSKFEQQCGIIVISYFDIEIEFQLHDKITKVNLPLFMPGNPINSKINILYGLIDEHFRLVIDTFVVLFNFPLLPFRWINSLLCWVLFVGAVVAVTFLL